MDSLSNDPNDALVFHFKWVIILLLQFTMCNQFWKIN